jgi:carbon storage regulator CsrA
MLVLARKRNEVIKIGSDIVITVLEVRGSTVRLGIDAPKSVVILRGELEPREQAPVSDSVSEHAAESADYTIPLDA